MPHLLQHQKPFFAHSLRLLPALILGAALAACGNSEDSPTTEVGQWTVGDLHSHTVQSDDADVSQTLDRVLSKAFSSYGLDWLAVSNHLRSSSRDNDGNTLKTAIPFAQGMEQYEIPRIQALQAAGTYADKNIFSLSEWDMPTHDHINVGIFKTGADGKTLVADTDGFKAFQYFFSTLAESSFDSASVAAWKTKFGSTRYNSTAADALQGIAWLKTNYPTTSFMQLNHPSRKPVYTISDLRSFNDLAPDLLFTIEGMPGNQMEPNRGGYDKPYTDAYLPNRTYGGADYFVAKLGGVWDALLGEGRHIWTTANSDSHFKTTTQYSSGYFPGEYAKNYVWSKSKDVKGLLEGLRSGKMFAVFGDLINALDFSAASGSGKKEMGGDLSVASGAPVTLTIRFKSPAKNNYEKPINSGNFVGVPVVDHIDLIAGDVTGKASPGSSAYSVATNPTTRVIKRFTRADWKADANGYYTVSYTTTASKSQYFRLRGTNLGTDVNGQTSGGEPQPDQLITTADNSQRFNDINDRNYASLWFYSNPIFVTVK
ncbi:S-layer protein [Niveibacterium terrae]|uniref:S-layer protein n=1 Tax=Niveibacterium terrae TaxID=3373598 RepID=UPI003A91D722